MIPEGGVTFRSDILNSLASAPLQHGTFVLFALAVVVAAGLGLAVMLLELALGAAEREVDAGQARHHGPRRTAPGADGGA